MKHIINRLASRLVAITRPFMPAESSVSTGAGEGRLVPDQSPPHAPVQQVSEEHETKRKSRKSRDTTEFATGDVIEGQISGIEHYGLFVRLPNGESGLVFQNEICWPGEDVSHAVGDTVKVIVIGFKPGRGLALSLRAARAQEAFDNFVRDFPVGSRVDGTIKSVLDYGVFVTVAPGVSGLLHVSAVPSMKAYGKHSLGERISVRVTAVEVDQRRISLGLVA